MTDPKIKRVVVAFDAESIKYANTYGLNKTLEKCRTTHNCRHWDVKEFNFDTQGEAIAFIKGVKMANSIDEPFINLVRKTATKAELIDKIYCEAVRKFTGGKEEVATNKAKAFYKFFLTKVKKYKGKLNESVFDALENDNRHNINGVLYVNGFFNFHVGASHHFMVTKYKSYKF